MAGRRAGPGPVPARLLLAADLAGAARAVGRGALGQGVRGLRGAAAAALRVRGPRHRHLRKYTHQ